jgi:hypothetical protein
MGAAKRSTSENNLEIQQLNILFKRLEYIREVQREWYALLLYSSIFFFLDNCTFNLNWVVLLQFVDVKVTAKIW